MKATVLLLLLALVAVPWAAAQDTGVPPGGLGASVSYPYILVTHNMKSLSTIPVSPEIYGRFLGFLEAGVFGAYGSGTDAYYDTYQGFLVGAEIRLAPAGRFYQPYAGLGVAYSLLWFGAVSPSDPMWCSYISIAPLRFDLRSLFGYGADIHPIVSVLQIRYGPLFYDGSLPSVTDRGNFLAAIDLARISVLFGL